jgi:Raf kinase inhibitor-like YbhB/YbcL family protein
VAWFGISELSGRSSDIRIERRFEVPTTTEETMRAAKRTSVAFAFLMVTGVHGALGAQEEGTPTITITSTAFSHEGTIPLEYSAYGDNTAPDLEWSGLPKGTVQLTLIVDDPIPGRPQPFVHWVAYNISPSASTIPANGVNGFRHPGYFGPRPPDAAPHTYHFKIYALDADLALPDGLGKDELLVAIEGHVLGFGVLLGQFTKPD